MDGADGVEDDSMLLYLILRGKRADQTRYDLLDLPIKAIRVKATNDPNHWSPTTVTI